MYYSDHLGLDVLRSAAAAAFGAESDEEVLACAHNLAVMYCAVTSPIGPDVATLEPGEVVLNTHKYGPVCAALLAAGIVVDTGKRVNINYYRGLVVATAAKAVSLPLAWDWEASVDAAEQRNGYCHSCHAVGRKLLRCSRCRASWVCDAACNRALWLAEHKVLCPLIARTSAAGASAAPAPEPKPSAAAACAPVPAPGIRIRGSRLTDEAVLIDDSFIPHPTGQALGLPLVVKLLPRSPDDDRFGDMYVGVRFMTDPRLGLAPESWQYGGELGPMPALLVARTDGAPFTARHWAVLDEYMDSRYDDDDRPGVSRRDFERYVREGLAGPQEPEGAYSRNDPTYEEWRF